MSENDEACHWRHWGCEVCSPEVTAGVFLTWWECLGLNLDVAGAICAMVRLSWQKGFDAGTVTASFSGASCGHCGGGGEQVRRPG